MLTEQLLESYDDNDDDWLNDITLHFADLHLASKTDKTEKNAVENDDYYKNNSNDKQKWTKHARIAKLTRCTVQQQRENKKKRSC
jgi:hypothetical protein